MKAPLSPIIRVYPTRVFGHSSKLTIVIIVHIQIFLLGCATGHVGVFMTREATAPPTLT